MVAGYQLSFEPDLGPEEPDGVFAAIAIDLEQAQISEDDLECGSACVPVLGITHLQRGHTEEPSYVDGTFRASSGDWTMTIEIYDSLIELWKVDVGQALLESIQPVDVDGGLPAFTLSPPLRWATDDEIPLQMDVSYPSFVVRRGCGDLSVGCTQTGSVQVIPTEVVYEPAPEWDYDRHVKSSSRQKTVGAAATYGVWGFGLRHTIAIKHRPCGVRIAHRSGTCSFGEGLSPALCDEVRR